MNSPVVRVTGLTRSFEQGGVRIDVLRGIDLAIEPGEILALLGPSGSGKSTRSGALADLLRESGLANAMIGLDDLTMISPRPERLSGGRTGTGPAPDRNPILERTRVPALLRGAAVATGP